MARPDLNLLFALDALLEEGSVMGAARRMNLSPPAMSRTLSRIRDTLDDPVFVQVGRKLLPTPRAYALREQVRTAVEQATQVLSSNTEIDLLSLERSFNVRATDEFVNVHLGHLLEAMAKEMPKAMLRLSPEEDDMDDDALRSGRIDLFISASRKLAPDIHVQPLFTTHFVGVAREHHPIFDEDISLERFVRWDHINVSRRGKGRSNLDALLQASGLQRNVALVVSNPYTALFALHDSDLLLPLPKHLASSAKAAGLAIRVFDLPVPMETAMLVQAWHMRLQTDPAHQWLRTTIHRLCTEDDAQAAKRSKL